MYYTAAFAAAYMQWALHCLCYYAPDARGILEDSSLPACHTSKQHWHRRVYHNSGSQCKI